MFCPNCGKQIDDVAKFCASCGCEIVKSEATAEIPCPPVVLDNLPGDDARAAVKKMAKGGLFLTAVILFTAAIFINLAINIGVSLTFDSALDSYYRLLAGIDSTALQMIEPVSSVLSSSMLVGVIVGNIPSFLLIFGLWMIFGSAAKKEKLCPSTAGFSICKGVNITNMVLVIIAYSLVILVSLILVIAGGVASTSSFDSEAGFAMLMVGGVLLVIFAFALVINIICFAKVLKTIKAVTTTIRTGVPVPYASRFVMVMCFIGGGLSAIGSLIAFNIGGMASAAASILFGIIIIQYRNQMKVLCDKGSADAEVTSETQA